MADASGFGLKDGEETMAPSRFTTLVGAPVHDAAGHRLGRVTDFSIQLAEVPPRVELVVLRRGRRRLAVPWGEVERFDGAGLRLRAGCRISPAPLARDAVLLTQAVLDTQVIDLVGKRVARVGDVQLAASNGGLCLVALEVGVDAVLRRLGLPWLARRAKPQTLAWKDVHLASPRGHALQLEAPTAAIHRLTPAELAQVVAQLPPPRADELLGRVPAIQEAVGATRASRGRRFPFRLIRRASS